MDDVADPTAFQERFFKPGEIDRIAKRAATKAAKLAKKAKKKLTGHGDEE